MGYRFTISNKEGNNNKKSNSIKKSNDLRNNSITKFNNKIRVIPYKK